MDVALDSPPIPCRAGGFQISAYSERKSWGDGRCLDTA